MSSASVFLSAMVVGITKTRSSSVHRRLEPTKKTTSNFKFVTVFRNPSNIAGAKRSFRVTASDHRSEQADNSGTGVQEDLNYLLKLGVGSVIGAAIIKYGSVLLPEITTPNLSLALFIILTPVVISIILLFLSSSSSSKNQN